MRAQPTGEEGVAVVEQVLGRERRGGEVISGGHILRRFLGGDVLEHHLELGHVAAQRCHHAVDEDSLAVKHVDVGIGHLAMHQQQQAMLLHRLQGRVSLADVGHARVAVGRGTRWVELERDDTGVFGADDLIDRRAVGQIHRHQWREVQPSRDSGGDAFAVGHGLRGSGDRRAQIGHHDGAGELAGRVWQHTAHRGLVTQMQMPVVGASEGQGRHRGRVAAAGIHQAFSHS